MVVDQVCKKFIGQVGVGPSLFDHLLSLRVSPSLVFDFVRQVALDSSHSLDCILKPSHLSQSIHLQVA